MCGICGALWTNPLKEVDLPVLDRMTDLLRHRGPDDRGTFWQKLSTEMRPGIALGHRRLSILDLSPSGRQPMPNEDETVWIVFNGEIYNFDELRKELLGRGHRFRSDGDTEVLIHLYEDEGERMLERLNGMFAFAIWDSRRHRLFLARDRIGKKPFFYRLEPDRILFASELKSILIIGDVPRKIAPGALDDYLAYQYVPHPQTIFQGISKLPPGHFAVWEPNESVNENKFIVTKYWNPNWNEDDDKLSFEEWGEELRCLVSDAVRIRLRSDVPVGAFLSGGIDSSVTAGLMQRLGEQIGGEAIRTFCVGFPQAEYDESSFARRTAERLGTRHREFIVSPPSENEIKELLQKLVWHYDEPFADSSVVPTWTLCEMTRSEVTVALSGDGGDEMFAGYDRYRAVRLGQLAEKMPAFLRRFLANPIRKLIPGSTRQRSTFRRLKRFLEALDMEPMEQYFQWIAIFNNERRRGLYSDEFFERLDEIVPKHDALDFLRQAETNCLRRDRVSRTALVDMQTYLPCDLMTKVDIASMAHSLEVRAPLLDYRIAEWSARMPIHYKILGNRGKVIFRETFKEFLPPDIKNRPKTGFGVPIDHWFRGPLKNFVQEILLDSKTIRRGFFNRSFIETILKDHFANRFDHAYRIWSLLILELWMRRWLDA